MERMLCGIPKVSPSEKSSGKFAFFEFFKKYVRLRTRSDYVSTYTLVRNFLKAQFVHVKPIINKP